MNVLDALRGVSAKHRSVVARAVGAGPRASAEEIARRLLDPASLAAIADGLSEGARAEALRKALPRESQRHGAYHSGYLYPTSAGELELETHGLVFGCKRGWQTDYVVPDDMRGPLLVVLAGRHAAQMRPGEAERWVGAPLQLAHDAAAVWAALHRVPARLKTDGELYQRSWPKLLQALPATPLFEGREWWLRYRVDAALEVLREEGCLRVRLDGSNGWETKRELVPTGDLAPALTRSEDGLRERLGVRLTAGIDDVAAITLLTCTGELDCVSLSTFGTALSAMLEQAGMYFDGEHSTFVVGVVGLAAAWLLGLVEFGLDGHGEPVAARMRDVVGLAEPEPEGERERARAVCQSNFEVVLLAPPTPAERLMLELSGEPVPGQPHVYRITRRSVAVGEKSPVGPGGVLGALRMLAGEVPQNVARSVADWASGYGPPLRVRTAMMLDAGDRQTAELLAGGPVGEFVVERISDTLLAFPADRLDALRAALAAAGRELEPGLDRVSGRWKDEDRGNSAVERVWMASAAPVTPADGKLVSTVNRWRPPRPGETAGPPRQASPLVLVGPWSAESSGSRTPVTSTAAPANGRARAAVEPPLHVILRAIEEGEDVHIAYAGARGVTQRRITPFEVENSAVHAWCHLRDEECSFWVSSITEAVPADE